MTAMIHYKSSTHIAVVGNKEFNVRSLVPVFTDEERRNEDKQKVENNLYSIFCKYIA